MMEIRKITGEQCKTTRILWEEVFSEDSMGFTDYYFENKAAGNIGYVIGEDPYEAMMFRTPYRVQIGEELREISYIVGVATRKECRHRGYMKALLNRSFEEMYREKQAFTFLMPANPKIYEPFDFRYIYERDIWKLKDVLRQASWLESLTVNAEVEEENGEIKAAQWTESITSGKMPNQENAFHKNMDGLYSVVQLQEQCPKFPIMKLLAEFANRQLKEHYNVFVNRDEAYYERQLKESRAQNGDIYVFFRRGELQAYFLYANEDDEIFIQEVIEKEKGILDFLQKEKEKKPVIMARIIHLEEMLKLVRDKKETKVILRIRDEMIEENNGVYQWEISEKGSKVRKLEDHVQAEISLHIRELSNLILQRVFINEIV